MQNTLKGKASRDWKKKITRFLAEAIIGEAYELEVWGDYLGYKICKGENGCCYLEAILKKEDQIHVERMIAREEAILTYSADKILGIFADLKKIVEIKDKYGAYDHELDAGCAAYGFEVLPVIKNEFVASLQADFPSSGPRMIFISENENQNIQIFTYPNTGELPSEIDMTRFAPENFRCLMEQLEMYNKMGYMISITGFVDTKQI